MPTYQTKFSQGDVALYTGDQFPKLKGKFITILEVHGDDYLISVRKGKRDIDAALFDRDAEPYETWRQQLEEVSGDA